MAAPAHPALIRRLGRGLRAIAGWLALMLALYGLSGWIGSSIPRNAGWQEAAAGDPDSVEIMVESNGVHTAIVMPLVTPQKDWRRNFPAADLAAPDRPYSHVAVSWGESDVFLNTPTWADLSPLTVLRVVTVGGSGLLHVEHHVRPAPGETIRPLRIGAADYARLVRRIETQVTAPGTRRRHPGYGPNDVFYDAPGRYTPITTCNRWTGDMLAGAGIRTGWWTPFAGSVMKWVPVPAMRDR